MEEKKTCVLFCDVQQFHGDSESLTSIVSESFINWWVFKMTESIKDNYIAFTFCKEHFVITDYCSLSSLFIVCFVRIGKIVVNPVRTTVWPK